MNEVAAPPERRHRRRTVRVLTEYQAGDDRRAEYATTLGGGGLFIETETPLPQLTPLVVRFQLFEGRPLHQVAGRVVWRHEPTASGSISRTHGMGIEFTDAVAAARVALELDDLP